MESEVSDVFFWARDPKLRQETVILVKPVTTPLSHLYMSAKGAYSRKRARKRPKQAVAITHLGVESHPPNGTFSLQQAAGFPELRGGWGSSLTRAKHNKFWLSYVKRSSLKPYGTMHLVTSAKQTPSSIPSARPNNSPSPLACRGGCFSVIKHLARGAL